MAAAATLPIKWRMIFSRDGAASRARHMLGSLLLPGLVVLIGVGGSLMAAHRITSSEHTGQLDRRMTEVAGEIGARIDRVAGLVAGAAAHFSRLDHDPARVTDEHLQDYLDAVGAERYDDLTAGVSYVTRVYRDDLDGYVSRRQWTQPTFTVGEGPNRVYPAIVWATTAGRDRHGLRMDADPDCSTALAEALMRDRVVVTAPTTTPGRTGPSVHVFGPVSDADDRPLGWIATEVQVEDLLPGRDALGSMQLYIKDNGVSVYGSPPPDGSLQGRTTIDVLDRSWRITASAPAPLVDVPILIAGLALTLLTTGATVVAQRTRRRLTSDVSDVRRSRDRYAGFLNGMIGNLELGIMACDEEGCITVTNPAAERMLSGLTSTLAPGVAVVDLDLVDGEGRPHSADDLPLIRAMRGEDVCDVEFVLRLGEEARTLLVNAQSIRDGADAVVGGVAIFHDITDRKAVEARMTHLAMHDHLTGLANRRQLAAQLETSLRAQQAGGPELTLLSMDLDRFKQVNDTSGHHRGDQMLIDVARRLDAVAHPGDLPARMGGDEFILLCPHETDEIGARTLAHRVAGALGPALVVECESGVRSGVSIGLVRPANDATVEDVLRQADLAMYDAKRERADSVRVYEPGLGRRAAERFATEAALRRALAGGTLGVAYQPVVDLHLGAVIGVEALVRWERDGQPQPPLTFLPLAEETGLITDLDLFVLDTACAAMGTTDGHALIGVNMSARTLALPDLVERVADVLGRHGVAPHRLVLELTEHALIAGSSTTDRSLAMLSAMGVRLSLDDFGTGYASLAYLRRFPVASIKIDRTFVTDLASSEEDRAIVSGTIQMAGRLGLRTVAEGVETSEQATLLTEMGCDLLQGYLFGWPTSFEQAINTSLLIGAQ